MADGLKEIHFEEHITAWLIREGGYHEVHKSWYDQSLCLIKPEVIVFLKESQPDAYNALFLQYGEQTDLRIVQNLAANISRLGALHVLRFGYKDRGQLLKFAYFQPSNAKNADHQALHLLNRFAVVRQLVYSAKNKNSIDQVVFLNGIPLFTAELKNALTGQYITEAIKQYKNNRDPKETLLDDKHCLVHFAVSTEKVFMATRLKGDKSYFLPFNRGIENPIIDNDFSTAYLWKEIWSKDSLLDLVQNFVNIQVDPEKYYDEKTRQVKEKKNEKMIFPRYHQLMAVRNMLKSLKTDGVGTNYLIAHSAGSGKSNTISWLAHRLAGFYQHPDDDNRLFDSIIVVTDRRILDKQIRDNIQQFEQVPGVVEAIDDKKTSQDLRIAIEKGRSIIVTTLQKFPVISDTVSRFPDRRYAVIIDEAHSSQSGESARHLRKSLSLEEAEKLDQDEKSLDDIILDEISQRGRQKNISFFAFTATPKNKTIELFGTKRNGVLEAFDEYTMEQAIKEGFILDVLLNYTSFKRYYRLAKRPDIDDKEYETKKTIRLLNSYVDLQDNAIEMKTRILVEHFVSQTAKEIQGKARAMLITRSRLHAVRFKRKFDEVMREMKLPYSALVAFSGSIHDGEVDEDYTETSMNNLGGRISITDAFKTPQFRILIAANKYQTGFDEPMLHTMFVDKKLGGVNTVQTLSRLNRTAPGKASTMILDFVNDPEMIRDDFQVYYGKSYMEEEHQTDPNSLYEVLSLIEKHFVISKNDLEVYSTIYFKDKSDFELLQPILNACVEKFRLLQIADQDEFRSSSKDYIRLYRFLSQIITFSDVELEKYYVFLLGLVKKLPFRTEELPREVLEEVELENYKVQKEYVAELTLVSEPTEFYGIGAGAGNTSTPGEYDFLSNIIKTLNETYGLNLSSENKEDFEKIKKQIDANENLMSFFNPGNSRDNIRDKFYEELDDALLQFVNHKLELYNKLTEDKANATMKRLWFNELYDQRVRGISNM